MAAGRSKMGISPKVMVLAALMAVVILGVAWVSVVTLSSTDPQSSQRDTLVLGDSITRLSADEIMDATGAEVVAFDNATWVDLSPAVTQTMAERDRSPERVAMLIGANDVLNFSAESADYGSVLDQLDGVPCVVVFEIPKVIGGLHRQLNSALAAEATKRPNLVTDDEWSILANRNLDQPNGSWFEEDRIHPNAEGRRQLAKVYAAALDRHCGQGAR